MSPSKTINQIFAGNIVILIVLNFLVKPIYVFAIDRKYQLLFPEDYAIFSTWFNTVSMIKIVCDMGIQTYLNREIASNISKARQSISEVSSAFFWLNLVYLAISTIIYLLLFTKTIPPNRALLIAFIPMSTSVFLFGRSIVSGLGYYTKDAFLSVLDRVFLVFTLGLALLNCIPKYAPSMNLFIWAQSLSGMAGVTICLWIIIKNLPQKLGSNIHSKNIFSIFKSSIPIAISIFLMTLYYRGDSFLVRIIVPEKWIQINSDFFKIFRITDALNMVGLLFAGLLLPMFASLSRKSIESKNLAGLSLRIILLINFCILLPLYFYADWFITFLYPSENEHLVSYFRCHLFSFFGMSLVYVFSTMLTAYHDLTKANLAFLGAIILSVTIHLGLDDKYGLIGPILANTLSICLVGVLTAIICTKIYQLDWTTLINGKKFLVFLLCTLVVISLLYWLCTPIFGFILMPSFILCNAILSGWMDISTLLSLARKAKI